MRTLASFFAIQLQRLECDENTKAYIVSVFDRYKKTTDDYSKESITLIYADARNRQDFETFQSIADWVFMSSVYFPESLRGANKNYYFSIAKMSYYSCFRMTAYKLLFYEQMADDFCKLSINARNILINDFVNHRNYDRVHMCNERPIKK